MKIAVTIIITIVAVIIVAAAVTIGFIYSGWYNISVLNHDTPVVNWALDTGMTHSVHYHSRGIKTPPLSDPAMTRRGFDHYNAMCVVCHGAPGVQPKEIASGLWPTAPNLAKTVPEWTPAELFWITKNGIKFTAMPAWGPTYSDSEIWDIVAFLEQLPKLAPADYKKLE